MNSIRLKTAEYHAVVDFCTPGMFRFRAGRTGEFAPDEDLMVARYDWPPVKRTVRRDGAFVSVATDAIDLKIDTRSLRFGVYDKKGKLVHSDLPHVDFRHDNVTFRGRRYVINKRLFNGEQFFGFGGMTGALAKCNLVLDVYIKHPMKGPCNQGDAVVPFGMSTRGYGLFLHTGNRSRWDLGKTDASCFSISAAGAEIDYYFVYGPSFKDILRDYTGLTGRPDLPPKWCFGTWFAGYWDQARVLDIARTCKKQKIPADVIHVDSTWNDHGGFEFVGEDGDGKDWPSPDKAIQELKQLGFRLSVHQNPFIAAADEKSTRLRDEIIEKGFSSKRFGYDCQGESIYVDFTDPAVRKWWIKHLKKLTARGVGGLKLDRLGDTIPPEAVFKEGTGKEIHNLYVLYYLKTLREGLGKSVVLWPRDAYAGAQRYATFIWNGDWPAIMKNLPLQIRMGQAMGLSGFPFWSSDGGGLGDPGFMDQDGSDGGVFGGVTESDEVYVRWAIQFGFLSPVTEFFRGLLTSLPWEFPERVCNIFRKYAALRYSLLPYLYACAKEAAETGIPMMRAMVLEFQDDTWTYDKDFQYMLGPSLLVAPVYRHNAHKHTVYLPEGRWIDVWTGKVYRGRQNIEIPVTLEDLPLFVKEGAKIAKRLVKAIRV